MYYRGWLIGSQLHFLSLYASVRRMLQPLFENILQVWASTSIRFPYSVSFVEMVGKPF